MSGIVQRVASCQGLPIPITLIINILKGKLFKYIHKILEAHKQFCFFNYLENIGWCTKYIVTQLTMFIQHTNVSSIQVNNLQKKKKKHVLGVLE